MLAEEAAAGTEYLRCQALAKLQTDKQKFYQALHVAVQMAVQMDDGDDAGRSLRLRADETAALEVTYAPQNVSETEWTSNLDSLCVRWAEMAENRKNWISQTAQLNLDILSAEHAVGAGCTPVPLG